VLAGARELLSCAPMRNATWVLALVLLGCDKPVEVLSDDAGSPVGSAAAAPTGAAAAAGMPVDPEKIAKVVNPKGEKPYAGPTGRLLGVIRYEGDPPPDSGISFPSGKCPQASAFYGKKFRTGQDRTLADVMVAVTGYSGYVPESADAHTITLQGCAPSRRTVAMTFGQRLEIKNLDDMESYMPFLEGARNKAVMVAIPRGDAVKLYPQQPARYKLVDQLPKPFLQADVWVLAYATHDVTDLDGRYEITRIPVGKVMVNAFLPSMDWVKPQEVEIKEGDNTLDITLGARAAGPGSSAAPASTSAASARPAASAAPGASGAAVAPKKKPAP
jgi:hypothetical protein